MRERGGSMAKRHLLVVDDDPAVVTLVEAVFGDEGRVTSAESAETALIHLQATDPDVVLLDVRLPGMSGIELLELMRERGIDIPVVLMSSYAGSEARDRGLAGGAREFLAKPLRPTGLEEVVEEALVPEDDPRP